MPRHHIQNTDKYYIMREHEINEVAMRPTEFGQAIQQGAEAGVRVGYEFEVLVPKGTVQKYEQEKKERGEDQLTSEQLVTALMGGDFFNADIDDIPVREFLKFFKPKNPKLGEQMISLTDSMAESGLKKVKEQFEKLPSRNRITNIQPAMDRLRQYIIRNRRDYLTYEQKQLRFAVFLASQIGHATQSSQTYDVAMKMQRDAHRALGYGFTYKDLFRELDLGYDVPEILLKNFQFDDPGVKKFAADVGREDIFTVNDDRYGGLYGKASSMLKDYVGSTMGTNVHIFYSYHEARKNTTDWYIEPDGSLEPDGYDTSAEVVSPPLPATAAIEALKKFYGITQQLNLYTNDSTGLHINVSIPEKIDVLKLAVFLGDTHVAKSFGRDDNEYVNLTMQSLQRKAAAVEPKVAKTTTTANTVFNRPGTTTTFDPKKLQTIAKDATGFHTASISYNGKYISFRHAGGNYLADYAKIYNTVGRFIRAMIIASNPQLYRNEYLAKLMKLFRPAGSQQTNNQVTGVAAMIQQHGIPVLEFDCADSGRASRWDTMKVMSRYKIPVLLKSIGLKMPTNQLQARLMNLTADGSQKLATLYKNPPSDERSSTLIVGPTTLESLKVLMSFTPNESEDYYINPYYGGMYFFVSKKFIPLSDQFGQRLLKTMVASKKAKK